MREEILRQFPRRVIVGQDALTGLDDIVPEIILEEFFGSSYFFRLVNFNLQMWMERFFDGRGGEEKTRFIFLKERKMRKRGLTWNVLGTNKLRCFVMDLGWFFLARIAEHCHYAGSVDADLFEEREAVLDCCWFFVGQAGEGDAEC